MQVAIVHVLSMLVSIVGSNSDPKVGSNSGRYCVHVKKGETIQNNTSLSMKRVDLHFHDHYYHQISKLLASLVSSQTPLS